VVAQKRIDVIAAWELFEAKKDRKMVDGKRKMDSSDDSKREGMRKKTILCSFVENSGSRECFLWETCCEDS
jgi:hypothetical protein